VGLFLGYLICHLSAEVFFLLNIFFGEGGCEVFGLEDLADLYVAVACGVGVGTALDPLDGLFERLDLPEPEAGDEFLRFGEGAVGDGAVLIGEVDAGAFGGGVTYFDLTGIPFLVQKLLTSASHILHWLLSGSGGQGRHPSR
jgi:hypothetical protein